jgi:hypothetical protein
MERERRRVMINQVLAGKGSFIWLFLLGGSVSEAEMGPVRNIYKEYLENDYASPLCRSFGELRKFLRMENYFFKIITDV